MERGHLFRQDDLKAPRVVLSWERGHLALVRLAAEQVSACLPTRQAVVAFAALMPLLDFGSSPVSPPLPDHWSLSTAFRWQGGEVSFVLLPSAGRQLARAVTVVRPTSASLQEQSLSVRSTLQQGIQICQAAIFRLPTGKGPQEGRPSDLRR